MAKRQNREFRQERFIDRFKVIMLDMGQTFMFEVDRFDIDDPLGRTYHELKGELLDGAEVHQILTDLFQQMIADSQNPENYDKMPTVSHYLNKHPASAGLPALEKALLEEVFARHEIGVIPEAYIEVLKQLRQTHLLGLVSDIWSSSADYYAVFDGLGIRELFTTIVFSSDVGLIKPSSKIFAKAAEAFTVEASEMVYIGDSLRRDVAGAQDCGMATVWIQPDQPLECDSPIRPDLIVSDLQEILYV